MSADQMIQYIVLPVGTIIFILIGLLYSLIKDNEKDISCKDESIDKKCTQVNARLTKISTELYDRISKIESNSIPNVEKSIIRLETKVETLLDNVAEININLKSTTSALLDLRETLISLKYKVDKKINE